MHNTLLGIQLLPVSVVHVGVVAEKEAESPEQAPHLAHTELLLTATGATL